MTIRLPRLGFLVVMAVIMVSIGCKTVPMEPDNWSRSTYDPGSLDGQYERLQYERQQATDSIREIREQRARNEAAYLSRNSGFKR